MDKDTLNTEEPNNSYTTAHKRLIYERAYHEQSMNEQDVYERAWAKATIAMDAAFIKNNWETFDTASETLDTVIYDHYRVIQRERARRDDHQ